MKKNYYAALWAKDDPYTTLAMPDTGSPSTSPPPIKTETSLEQAYSCFHGLIDQRNIFVISPENLLAQAQKQLPMLPASNFLIEPVLKDTAIAIAYFAFKIKRINPDARIILAPGFEKGIDRVSLLKQCGLALDFLKNQEALIMIGRTTDHPKADEIQFRAEYPESVPGISTVIPLTEKASQAHRNILTEKCLTDTGIYLSRADYLVDSFCELLPDVFDLFVCGLSAFNTPYEKVAIKHIYKYASAASFVRNILLKQQPIRCIPLEEATPCLSETAPPGFSTATSQSINCPG